MIPEPIFRKKRSKKVIIFLLKDIEGAAYIKGLTNKEAAGELGKNGLLAMTELYKDFAKKNGFKTLILIYERSEGSSSKIKGGPQQRTFDLTK